MKHCTECGKPADAPKEQQSSEYPICASCLKHGWTDVPEEVLDAMENDGGFRLGVSSPIQRHDL